MASKYTKAQGSLFRAGGYGMHVSLDMFFDLPGVIAKMDKKTERVLGATGAFARTVMQRGMRKRKRASREGDYPSAHGNPLLREKIRFGYDAARKELVVGPALLDSPDREVAAVGKTVPELLNYGGTVSRRFVWDRVRKEIRPIRRNQQPVLWRYKPRPFVELTRPKAAAKLRENMEKFDLK